VALDGVLLPAVNDNEPFKGTLVASFSGIGFDAAPIELFPVVVAVAFISIFSPI
jgi:hypothetical protein